MRCFDLGVAVTGEVPIAEVIDKDQYYVGAQGFGKFR